MALSNNVLQSLGDVYQFAVVNGYPWKKLGPRTIVDCGGGEGNLSINLAAMCVHETSQIWNSTYSGVPNSLPDCRLIVQDLPEVVPLARANIERDIPVAFKEGRIIAETHNFFEPQPRVSDDGIFMFRYILHDWPDADCISILKNTMKAMGRKVRVVRLTYSCMVSYMRSQKF